MMPSIVTTFPAVPRAMIDTVHRVETPEGIDLLLRPAGVIARSLAFIIDLGIRAAVLGVLGLILLFLGKIGVGGIMLSLFVINWWYMVLFEVLNQGRTPGKQIMGLCVVHDDGTPIGWSSSLTRNLLRFIDSLPFCYAVGLVSCLLNTSFKRLGDITAGTLVVYQNSLAKMPDLPDVPGSSPPFPLTPDEQFAIQNFAERQATLSASRQEELAGILAAPLKTDPIQAQQQVNAIASGLLGSRRGQS